MELKDHNIVEMKEFPGIRYELRAARKPDGEPVEGIHNAWIWLDNPKQFNSYTTEMVKSVIMGFRTASMDRSVNCIIFTAVGDKAFCTGGNTKEYAEYYAGNPQEYMQYMRLFNDMVTNILIAEKPVICRVNGMRVAGGQEIGMATDLTVASDLARFGQAGPKHGSAPDGGSTDFLPWMLSIEDAMWNCISCEMWSAYKMKVKGLITKAVPVLKVDGAYVRNPLVITDRYVDDGEIVYGDLKTGEAAQAAKGILKSGTTDFTQLDREIDAIIWRFTNLFPGCLIKAIDGIRAKKKFFWDQTKLANRHWLAANMATEAYLGFQAFNTKKITGRDTIDFVKYRQLIAEGSLMNDEAFAAVMGQPNGK
jgi:6-oxo-cyclohex-1-ene-carbonyl-CoA hydrolase